MASELDALAAKMLGSKEFFPSRERTALFNYLWANRHKASSAIDIWEGALHAISRSKKKDKPIVEYNYNASVRQSCFDLKGALNRYFANATQGCYFDLPPAKREIGR